MSKIMIMALSADEVNEISKKKKKKHKNKHRPSSEDADLTGQVEKKK